MFIQALVCSRCVEIAALVKIHIGLQYGQSVSFLIVLDFVFVLDRQNLYLNAVHITILETLFN